MSKPKRHRTWNPAMPEGRYKELAIDWGGDDEPKAITFVRAEDLDFSHGGGSSKGAMWRSSVGLKIIATIDNTHHGRLLHLSVSHPRILPPWPVMIAVKRWFFPEHVAAAMVMPEEACYVNEHPNCLHIWQLPVEWGIG